MSLWQAHEATAARNDLGVNLYAADMASVHQAIQGRRFDRARDLLRRHIPAPGAEDHRGWEWRWFWQEARPQYVQLLKGDLSPLPCIAIIVNFVGFANKDE